MVCSSRAMSFMDSDLSSASGKGNGSSSSDSSDGDIPSQVSSLHRPLRRGKY